MPDEELTIVSDDSDTPAITDDPSATPERVRKPYPKLGGGNQKSFKLSKRISAYVSARSSRHGVSEAEIVRAMLNERIDHEEMMERAYAAAVMQDSERQKVLA